MSINSAAATAQDNANVVSFVKRLASVKSVAGTLSSGAKPISEIVAAVRTLDDQYTGLNTTFGQLAAIRSTEEETAAVAIKTALDDLFIAIADQIQAANATSFFDLGSGYAAASTRAQKLAAIDRSLPYKTITIPAGITAAATAVQTAVDDFNALS